MITACLLCRSNEVKITEELKTSDLISIYNRKFGIDTVKEFKTSPKIFFNHCQVCDLKFFTPLCPGSEKFYEGLQKFDWYYMSEKAEYLIAKDYIASTDKVLDVGCGRGAFKLFLNIDNYTGLELSNEAIKIGKKNNVIILNENVETHSIKHREQYDIVCSFQVLEHVPNVYEFIEHSLACLKPGGLLLLSVPSDDSFIALQHNLVLNMPPHHISRWSDRAMESIGRIFNLQTVALKHDPVLNKEHEGMYLAALVRNSIENILGIKSNKLINLSITRYWTDKFGKLAALFLKKGMEPKLSPKGHSVTIVLRKS